MAGDDLPILTEQIKGLRAGVPADADLKLSVAARDRYLQAIKTFRDKIAEQKTAVAPLAAIGDPGSFPSAIAVKGNLVHDVTGAGGIEETLDHYLTYLDEFAQTVKDACDQFIKNG